MVVFYVMDRSKKIEDEGQANFGGFGVVPVT